MTGLLVFLVLVTALAYLAGYHMDRTPIRRLGKACFFMGLALIAFTGYFAWREHRTVGELAQLLDPVPRITHVTYVPNPIELQAISRALAAMPGSTFTGNTQAERRAMARRMETLHTRYWLLKTALSAKEVADFYAEPRHRQGWSVTTQKDSWITLKREGDRLIIFAAEDWPRPGTRVIYMYEGA